MLQHRYFKEEITRGTLYLKNHEVTRGTLYLKNHEVQYSIDENWLADRIAERTLKVQKQQW